MKKPVLGFAGVGRIGSRRMNAILEADVAEVGAVFDVNDAAARTVLEAAGLRSDVLVTEYDAMLDRRLDGVVVCTPNRLHAEQATMALSEGMAVFCQKPVGCNAAEVDRVIDAAKRVDRLLGIDLTYRRAPAMREIHQRAVSGEIGEIYAANLVFHNAYGPDKGWFYDRTQSGGGCFLDLGVHMVDLALWTMGFPRVRNVASRLFSKGQAIGRDDAMAIEDHAIAHLDFDNGATAQIACSWHLSAGCNAVIQATFHGTKGTLHMYNLNGQYFDLVAEKYVGTQKEVLVWPNGNWDSTTAIEWATRLATDNRFEPETVRHVEIARILDRVYGA